MTIAAMFRITGRAEFSSHSIKDAKGPDSIRITAQPIFDEGSNTSWSKWTPSGELQMQITNPACFDELKLGRTFRLTLDEVDPETLLPK